ncbi:4Fe-4S dicluster domain-containing protein [Caproiciproducens sp.]
MSGELLSKGILTTEYLQSLSMFPSEERMKRGPVAVAECTEKIPCNPCEASCRFQAIYIGENISNTPKINFDACVGCGSCITACSGLAIFVLDKSYSDTYGTVSFPFEYLTELQEGDMVDAVDRSGQVVCKGTVKKIIITKRSDRTPVIKLEVPIDWVNDVRGIKLR